jgi:S-adenosylmethionine decarboxylase
LEAIGTHCRVELYDCPRHLLDDEVFVKNALRGAVDEGLTTLLHEVSHRFHPQGVTALGLIAESHVSIHTWPEYGYAAADVFTCGKDAKPERACRYLVQTFQAGRHSLKKLSRGLEVFEGVTSEPSIPAEADEVVAQERV